MIQTETKGSRIRTYSDAGMMIEQVETGILYIDAVDVPNKYTYIETSTPIPREVIDVNMEAIEPAMRFMMGDGLVNLPPQEESDYLNENEPEPDYFNEEE